MDHRILTSTVAACLFAMCIVCHAEDPPEATTPAGKALALPATIGTLAYTNMTNYEADPRGKGLGQSYGYNGELGLLTVYFYDYREPDKIHAGTGPKALEQLKQAESDVKEMERRGYYKDVVIVDGEKTYMSEANRKDWLHTEVRMVRRLSDDGEEDAMVSHTLVRCEEGFYAKIRYTCPLVQAKAAEGEIDRIATAVMKMLNDANGGK